MPSKCLYDVNINRPHKDRYLPNGIGINIEGLVGIDSVASKIKDLLHHQSVYQNVHPSVYKNEYQYAYSSAITQEYQTSSKSQHSNHQTQSVTIAKNSQRPILQLKNISKSFGTNKANNNISLTLNKGEILALLGENGAGKSTLMNILYGLLKPDSGEIYLDNKLTNIESPQDALKKGLGMVHQHFMLVNNMSVIQNVILGNEPYKNSILKIIDYKKAIEDVMPIAKKLEIPTSALKQKVRDLPLGMQQRVAILKTLYRKSNILILDEPTSILAPKEIDELFNIIRTIVNSGVSVIIITHKLDEVMNLANRIVVIRKGELVGECDKSQIDKNYLSQLIVGKEVKLYENTNHRTINTVSFSEKDVMFELQNVAVPLNHSNDSQSSKSEQTTDLTLKVHKREILAVVGVDGNGQAELTQIYKGLIKPTRGKVLLHSQNINNLSTKERLNHKMGFIHNDRRNGGLVLNMSVQENLILGYQDNKSFNKLGILKFNNIRKITEQLIKEFNIYPPSNNILVKFLSGGNQQKVMLAREIYNKPDVILINQPTWGVDIGSSEFIHNKIFELKENGAAVILITLELEEALKLADNIAIIKNGKIVHQTPNINITKEELGMYMIGGYNNIKNEIKEGVTL